MCLIFFFQAEDGIRDLTVTGVQTCALPISRALAPPSVVRGLRALLRRLGSVLLRSGLSDRGPRHLRTRAAADFRAHAARPALLQRRLRALLLPSDGR